MFPQAQVLVFTLVLSIGKAQLVWELIDNGNATSVPLPRGETSLAYDAARDRLILFGGKTSAGVRGDTWSYDVATGRWREISTSGPSARFSMVSGISGDHFYISTGQSHYGAFLNDIWRFDLQSEQWEKLPSQQRPFYYTEQQWEVHQRHAVSPDYRYGAAGGVFNGSSSFIVAFGFSDSRKFDTFRYDTTNLHWNLEYDGKHPYNPSYPHARCQHAGTMVSDEQLVIFGGCLTGGGSGGPCPSGDSWMYNTRTRDWQSLSSCAVARTYASMVMLPMKQGLRRAVLYGGEEKTIQVITTVESPADQVALFNPDTKDWTLRQTTGDIPTKRSHMNMATGVTGIYMFGGKNEDGMLLNDLYLLKGDSASADLARKQAKCRPTFVNFILLHGVLMALSWGFFLQWGAFIARYFRHKDPTWFTLHRVFQTFGLVVSVIGVAFAFVSSKGHLRYAHSIIGIVVTVFGLLQPINAALRPHKPHLGEVKSIRRLVWEILHKNLGRFTLVLAIVQISLGVFLAVSHTAVWASWFGYLGFLLLAYVVAEMNKKCKETSSYETKGNLNVNSTKSDGGQQVASKRANTAWKPTPLSRVFPHTRMGKLDYDMSEA